MTWEDDLKHFLLNRENDIALDFEDFGSLEDVFVHFVGRKAEKAGKTT